MTQNRNGLSTRKLGYTHTHIFARSRRSIYSYFLPILVKVLKHNLSPEFKILSLLVDFIFFFKIQETHPHKLELYEV